MKKLLISLLLITSNLSFADDKCSGSFVNPITDVCWSCMFPIYISPLPIKWGYAGQKGSVVTEKKSHYGVQPHPLQLQLFGSFGAPDPDPPLRGSKTFLARH